jgi:succinate-acetate transporter protein
LVLKKLDVTGLIKISLRNQTPAYDIASAGTAQLLASLLRYKLQAQYFFTRIHLFGSWNQFLYQLLKEGCFNRVSFSVLTTGFVAYIGGVLQTHPSGRKALLFSRGSQFA